MDNFTFFDSSATALAMDDPSTYRKIGIEKYPWRSLPVGKSFHINITEGQPKFNTIQNSCYKWSEKLGRKFRAVNHGDKGIEVARLPDPVGTTTIVNLFDQKE